MTILSKPHPRIARLVTICLATVLTFMTVEAAVIAFYIGLVEPVFLAIIGGYALVLGVVSFKLWRRAARPSKWSFVSAPLVLAPFVLVLLFRLLLPQPDDVPSDPMVGPAIVAAFAALAVLAGHLNGQVELDSTSSRQP